MTLTRELAESFAGQLPDYARVRFFETSRGIEIDWLGAPQLVRDPQERYLGYVTTCAVIKGHLITGRKSVDVVDVFPAP